MTEYLSRAEIGLRPRTGVSFNINIEGLTGHYMGGSPWRNHQFDHARCASIWRAIQAEHMDVQHWTDIAYSSGVCPHGVRFEGRGPGVRQGANGNNTGNYVSLTVCYIAGGDDELTDAAKWALLDEQTRFGVSFRWSHSDWYATACCGDPFRDWIRAGCPAPDSPSPSPLPPPILPPEAPMALLDDTVNGEDRIEQITIDAKGVLKQSWQGRKHDKDSFVPFQVVGSAQPFPFVSATISTQVAGNCVITGLGAYGQRAQRFSSPGETGGYSWSDWYPIG